MIEVEVYWIDVSKNLQSGQQPHWMYERPAVRSNVGTTLEPGRIGTYWTPTSDFNVEGFDWAVTNFGKYVCVRVWPVHCAYVNDAAAFLSGLKTGLALMESLQKRTNREVEKVILALSSTCHDFGDKGIRNYLGICFQVKE